jgi:hypothetical protein
MKKKLGCLEIELVDDDSSLWALEDSCQECIFKKSEICPNDCSGDTHYELTKEFINEQTKCLIDKE